MRTIDLYRGSKPPCQQFDPCSNPQYMEALHEASAALEELKKYNVPKELILKIDAVQNKLTAAEVDLMWCFAFEKGMDFQKQLGNAPKEFDISFK